VRPVELQKKICRMVGELGGAYRIENGKKHTMVIASYDGMERIFLVGRGTREVDERNVKNAMGDVKRFFRNPATGTSG
jgi:hypothetical protein